MDPRIVEKLRQIIASIERKPALRTPQNSVAVPRYVEPARPAPEVSSRPSGRVLGPYPSLPPPSFVTAPAPGVRLFTYHLAPGEYPGLRERSAGEILEVVAGTGLLPAVTGSAKAADAAVRAYPVFLDLETTALGGAGALPFLAGIGYWSEGKFIVNQFLLEDRSAEASMLESVAQYLRSPLLVTFNGKCFDVPVLRDRFILTGAGPFPVSGAHLDLYAVSRRLGRKPGYTSSLGQCEARYLGFHRTGDIPSRAVPALYFIYEREGDQSVLAPVMRHNLMDVATMASLVDLFCDVMQAGPRSVEHPEALLGAAKMHVACKRYERARACLEAAKSCPLSTVASTLEFRHLSADVLWKLGEKQKAVSIMEELMREGGLDARKYSRLSAYYESLGDPGKALDIVEHALRELSRSPAGRKMTESLSRRASKLKKRLYGISPKTVSPE